MLVETLDRPAARFGDLGELQVLFHGQAGNDPPVFRDQSDPVSRGAKGQAHDRATAANLGANAFLSKPFSNMDIVAEVKRLTTG
jgi:hypothetical protein